MSTCRVARPPSRAEATITSLCQRVGTRLRLANSSSTRDIMPGLASARMAKQWVSTAGCGTTGTELRVKDRLASDTDMARNLQGGIEQANLGFRAPSRRPADNSRDARKEVRNHGN